MGKIQRRIDDSEQFLRRYVTMDETGLHYYTRESNRQSTEWIISVWCSIKTTHNVSQVSENYLLFSWENAILGEKDKSYYEINNNKIELSNKKQWLTMVDFRDLWILCIYLYIQIRNSRLVYLPFRHLFAIRAPKRNTIWLFTNDTFYQHWYQYYCY